MVDSIARITSALESARELTLEAAAVASSRFGETSYHRYSQHITPEGLRSLLNSRNDREVRDGMKKVASLLASDSENVDLESYFADVVKNIGSSTDIKVKRLVSIYLLRYAEKQPNLALLAVNSIQKSLADSDPQSRALALKMLSDIKIPSLYPIVLHSVKKAITDSAPEVRCSVSFALLKLFREQGEHVVEEISPLLKDLLADSDITVVSSAIVLLKEAFPDSLELLHGHFRRYCDILPQITQSSQVYLIDLLTEYCKKYVPRPVLTDSCDSSQTQILPEAFNAIPFATYDVTFDPDMELFLQAIRQMLHSPNPAVIVSISKALFELSPPVSFKNSKVTEVLAKLVSVPSLANDNGIILQCILMYCAVDPTTFSMFLKKFFLFPSDDTPTAIYKLKIIAALINHSNVKQIVPELKYYILSDQRPSVVQEALNSLAVCGQLSQSLSLHITKWLLAGMANTDKSSTLEAYVSFIRFLIQEYPSQHLGTMIHLIKALRTESSLSGSAKAGIIWLFGEFTTINFSICPDVLRIITPSFSAESRETRLQTVLLAAKILSCDLENFKAKGESVDEEYEFENSRVAQLAQAVFYLAKFDDDFDIRDRARLFSSLFDKQKFEVASLLLQAPKPAPICCMTLDIPTKVDAASMARLGLDHDMEDYLLSSPWECEQSDISAELRKPADLKDYDRFKTSFSSASFFNGNSNRDSAHGKADNTSNTPAASSRVFTSSVGKKYQLQSLDEFFSEIPSRPRNSVRKVMVEEDSTTTEEDTSEESTSGEESSENSTSDEDSSEDSSSEEEEENSMGSKSLHVLEVSESL
ncbi:LAME_0H01376g1_1 [Lachancea meyersii CBS 8951]|uniref:LAME_0H01376g1_1 n=1 Tax=Lachancea meyersii CBS 8951 TaxID=1266667 RepID=A0A1G4KDL9_9SACH|nr:LAME_0H01376g1_1 [Lachancea meyersii CBS 8951]